VVKNGSLGRDQLVAPSGRLSLRGLRLDGRRSRTGRDGAARIDELHQAIQAHGAYLGIGASAGSGREIRARLKKRGRERLRASVGTAGLGSSSTGRGGKVLQERVAVPGARDLIERMTDDGDAARAETRAEPRAERGGANRRRLKPPKPRSAEEWPATPRIFRRSPEFRSSRLHAR